jgi:hypothetical protein
MSEEPEVPQPVPEIPRRALWTILLLPPVLTVLANFAISLAGGRRGDLDGLMMMVPFCMFFVILALAFRFNEIANRRYRGRSFAFLAFAYFFGQILLCLTLWAGSCLLLMPNFR